MTKFLHTADWQLGMTRQFLSVEEQARYSQGQLDVVRRIASLAKSEGCAFVVVAGDVFESNQLDRKVLARALDAMAAFDVPVYLLPANHDPANAASIYLSDVFVQRCPNNVTVLQDCEPIDVPGAGVEVVGAPWDSKHPLEDLVQRACGALDGDGAGVRILVAHGAVDTLSPDASDPALIDQKAAEAAVGSGTIQYLALGDRHSVTEVGSTGRIWYSGAPLVTDYREVDPNEVLVVEVDRETIEVTRHKVGDWAFVTQTFDVNGRDDVEAVATWLSNIESKDKTVVKLSFVGTISLRDKAVLDEELEKAGDLFAALDTWERKTELAVLPDESDLQEIGLSGFAAEALTELRQLSDRPDQEGQTAQDALGLLYRLSGAGR
jgi:DNA repair exonuclease SbcCD nuclease subunit